MFEIIQAVRPDYIIGENVPGLLSIEGGMVFEQVCLDLESEGYEVQAFVLPACATGAPHRRDRVWIIGYNSNAKSERLERGIRASGAEGFEPGCKTDSGITSDTNEVRLQQCENRGEMGGGQAEICGTGGKSSNAIEANGKVETTSNTTSNGHSGGCTETGGEKRESEQRGLLEFEGANSGVNGNSKHDGPLAEQELRGNETSSDQWRQKEQNASEQSSGADRPNDATGIHGSEIRSEQHFTQNSWSSGCEHGINDEQGSIGNFGELSTGSNEWNIDAENNSDTNESGLRREGNSEQQSTRAVGNYWHDWPSLSPFHSGHDGLSPELVRHIRTSLSEAGETPENIEAYIRKEANYMRKEAIKCAGNAVVPTVVLQVMKAIQNHYENTNH